MARPRGVCCLILHLMVIATAQYNDDSDYDLVLYDDFSMDYGQKIGDEAPEYDDFYILAELEEPESSNSVIVDKGSPPNVFSYKDLAYKGKKANAELLDRYEAPEKAYRYTKHRIPGYDYEELDYLGARSFRRCDEKSIWTHCLCQFTCVDPDVVDCYTPCKSGCECKEDYVFDEKSQRCLLPEECPGQSNKENFL